MDLRPKPAPRISTSAIVQLVGPRCLLPQGNTTITVQRSLTWHQALIDNGFNVAPDGISYVSTQNYTTTLPDSGKGRRAELNTTVGDFLDAFRMNYCHLRKYTVKVCAQDHSAADKSRGKRRLSITSSASSTNSFATVTNRFIDDLCQFGNGSGKRWGNKSVLSNAPSTSMAAGQIAQEQRFVTAQVLQDTNTPTVPQTAKKNVSNSAGVNDECDDHHNEDAGRYNEGLENGTSCENERQRNQENNAAVNAQAVYEEPPPAKKTKISLQGISRESSSSSDSSDDEEEADKTVRKSRNSLALPPSSTHSNFGEGAQKQAPGPGALFDSVTVQGNTATYHDRRRVDQEVREERDTQENEDLTASMQQRMNLFNNAYKLRVRQELESLKGNIHRWNRFFTYAPLIVKMMADIFKNE